jgi:hypothetical protein|tara:strand:- start:410 stop:595 length:186 start_codon:yes stop_codon:yes gene_type:complete
MKFEYTITQEGGEKEMMHAMSWKKLFKSLLIKYPKFSGWCTYMNKHGHVQVKAFKDGKVQK